MLDCQESNARRSRVLDDYFTEDEAAAEVGQKKPTLRKWRAIGDGPPYVKIGRKIFYPRPELADWIRAKLTQPVRARRAA